MPRYSGKTNLGLATTKRQEPIQVLERGLIEDGVLETLERWGRGGAAMERGEVAMYYVGNNPNVPPRQLAPDGSNLTGGFKFVNNTHWLVQRNLGAGKEFLEHTVTWKSGSTKAVGDDESPPNGAGSGRNFINTLQRGDRIAVWARAYTPNAKNLVRSVEVDVYYSTI